MDRNVQRPGWFLDMKYQTCNIVIVIIVMHDHILHQQAIEIGNISTFEQSIQEMKKSGTTAPLNACRLTKGNGMVYSMTLLALSGFHGRKEMVDLLLQEGAGSYSFYTPSHSQVVCMFRS